MVTRSRVKFSHTKSGEKEYLFNLLKEKDWFVANNFSVFLPKNELDVKKIILKKVDFKKKIIFLKHSWGKIEADFFSIIKNFKFIKHQPSYYCHVSLYGPEGKFCRPNFIFVRLRTKRDYVRVVETIGHELLHLMLKGYFNKNKFSYRQVEKKVDDLIMNTKLHDLFPNYEKQIF